MKQVDEFVHPECNFSKDGRYIADVERRSCTENSELSVWEIKSIALSHCALLSNTVYVFIKCLCTEERMRFLLKDIKVKFTRLQ